jgi:hypothetical protein
VQAALPGTGDTRSGVHRARLHEPLLDFATDQSTCRGLTRARLNCWGHPRRPLRLGRRHGSTAARPRSGAVHEAASVAAPRVTMPGAAYAKASWLAPRYRTARTALPHRTVPHRAALRPHRPLRALQRTLLHRVAPHRTVSRRVASRRVASRPVVPYRNALRCTMPRRASPRRASPRRASPRPGCARAALGSRGLRIRVVFGLRSCKGCSAGRAGLWSRLCGLRKTPKH